MDEERTCIQIAVVEYRNDRAIRQAMRETHDRLIKGLGPRRKSGVRWRECPMPEALHLVQEIHRIGRHEYLGGVTSNADLQHEKTVEFLQKHPRAVLVIAECDV